jgi:hypothetical protein
MTIEDRVKPKISTEFTMPDGTTGTRSLMQDFRTLRDRIMLRLLVALGDDADSRHVLAGIKAYTNADYESALAYFTKAVVEHPEISEELRPHIRICKRVVASALTPDDITYRDAFLKWETLSRLIKYFRRTPAFKVRCKYCGHYTPYIHPERGFAYFHENNCELCGRGYPVPDFSWDGIDGQAYIYYRHSVTESEFYKELEDEYDVNPDHTFFMAKDNPKQSNK